MSKHLTVSDRITIAVGLKKQTSISQIADELGKDRSTISREIRKHIVIVDKGAPYRVTNRCIHRTTCSLHGICENNPNCTRKCAACARCNSFCKDYIEEKCTRLSIPPYVCNGCEQQNACVLRKAYYYPEKADQQYHELLSEARQGYNLTTLELRNIDEQISPLLKNGQSIHHAFVARGANITVSESTVSRLIKDRQLSATVMDQQRVVKLKPRKHTHPGKKVDRHCREGRTIEDYRIFLQEHSQLSAVEMDSVIGEIGGKSLLTMIFPQSELMIAFLCDCHTAACIQSKIDFLYEGLGDLFPTLFPIILTDNGSEFSNPGAIETAPDGSSRTRVFYCDPMASWQKPHVERNHELIRLIRPKGSSFDDLTQQKVGIMMSHINSYARPSLGDRSPFEVFAFLHGQDTLDKLLRLVCQTPISPENIVLKPSLLK
ncbi:MAG: IS30 family transposase [Oliverpabstia sp.]